MIKSKTASIALEYGPKFTITYSYLVLNDGGDYKLIVWEPLPTNAPSDEFGPDLILEKDVFSDLQVEELVDRALKDAVSTLIRSFIEVRSEP